MRIYGANLGMPHTKAMKDGLFEMRMKSKEGIGRVFYCTLGGCPTIEKPTAKNPFWPYFPFIFVK